MHKNKNFYKNTEKEDRLKWWKFGGRKDQVHFYVLGKPALQEMREYKSFLRNPFQKNEFAPDPDL